MESDSTITEADIFDEVVGSGRGGFDADGARALLQLALQRSDDRTYPPVAHGEQPRRDFRS